MLGEGQCPLCNKDCQDETVVFQKDRVRHFSCKRCGEFVTPLTVVQELRLREHPQRCALSTFTRDETDIGSIGYLTRAQIARVIARPPLSIIDRSERLLRFGVKMQNSLNGDFNVGHTELIPLTHSLDIREVVVLANFLVGQDLLIRTTMDGRYQVTPKGFIENGKAPASGSNTAFIAMWFNNEMNSARNEGLEPAILAAGYQPITVNKVEHINRIDDEIIAQIRKSRFLVADFTGHRGGVYFEAGFAMGLGLPVFWTCRKDHLSDLHFDIRQYNCIDWETTAELATRLQNRIEAVIGVRTF